MLNLIELPETFRNALGKTDKITSISREGDDFHYKTHLGDVDVDLSEKIGVETEWDEKGKKPILHILVSLLVIGLISAYTVKYLSRGM